MDCAGCARKIERPLRELEGVRGVSRHYPDTTLGVLHEAGIAEARIRSEIEALGFHAGQPPRL